MSAAVPAARRPLRFALLALAGVSLVIGVLGGLARIGWAFRMPPDPILLHGPVLVLGFLGTLICLERAVAAGQPAAYVPPLSSGLGGLALLVGLPLPAGQLLTLGAGLGLLTTTALVHRRHLELYALAMIAGAAAWVLGSVAWAAGLPVSRALPLWEAFLVLTVTGERLELSRAVLAGRQPMASFAAATAIFTAGALASPWAPDPGARLAGAGLVALAVWLLWYDLSRRTWRRPGQPGFVARTLIGGFAWLGVAGVLGGVGGFVAGGPLHDAQVHALLLGFVMSMVFAHAPIVAAGVLRVRLRYSDRFYVHVGLLHLSLLLRVGGDLLGVPGAARWGGLLNAVALLLFVLSSAAAARSVSRERGA